mmetsp:Transcript_37916/g.119731  ORF Transcript_37916/g.119731 Transcript_37916/m.119731 type:complete len:82 (-) Transcript_37916:135-380(-)
MVKPCLPSIARGNIGDLGGQVLGNTRRGLVYVNIFVVSIVVEICPGDGIWAHRSFTRIDFSNRLKHHPGGKRARKESEGGG